MKKQTVLFVLAACALATLAAAQVPVAPVSALVAPQEAVPAPPLPPPAPPAPTSAAPTIAPPAPPAPGVPTVAAAVAPQAPAAPAKPARPAKTPQAAQAPEPVKILPPPEPPPAPPAPGRERGEPDPVNIQLKVTVTVESGGKAPSKRVAILTIANGTGNTFARGMLRSGNSVPVASTSLMARTEDGKETPAAKPLTSYNYRSVGLNVDVEQAVLVAGNRVRASLNVEFSGVDEKTGPGSSGVPPSFPTFSQRVNLYLDPGKPVLVAQSTDVATGVTQMVEVEAKVLR